MTLTNLPKTPLGNTGIVVSQLGLGTVKLGRNTAVKYPTTFTIPDDKQALHLLHTAADCGINLLDTAPAYGNSEERLGHLLKKTQTPWVIATKVGEAFDPKTEKSTYNFTPEFIQQSIEESLHRLQKDCLDIVLVHSNGDDEKIIKHYGALEVLNHLKQKGWIRASGMSSKSVSGGLLAAQLSDIVMVTHNLNYQEEVAVIEYANEHNKGVFIKKAFASGHAVSDTENTVQKSFECIFEHKGVSSIILGSINPNHIQDNVQQATAVLQKIQNS